VKDLAPLSLIVVIGLVFFGEMIFASRIPLFRDLGPFFYPMRFSLAESFRAGDLPLWDRHLAMGFPLLANFQAGAFYPPNLVYLLFPFFAALKINFLLHSFIAALGAYLLARQWSYDRAVALMYGLFFSLGGCMVSMLNLLNHFQTAVWLPWLLLIGERQFLSNDRYKTLPCVFVATLQFLAGSPEIYVMSMLLYLLNSLKRERGKISLSQVFLSLLKINLFVAGLAMVQILPTLELLRETGRLRLPSFQGVTAWSLHPGNLLNLMLVDREVDTRSFNRFQSFIGLPAPFFLSLYMGALFPFGLWSWILTKPAKEKTVVLMGVALSLLLSMGSYTPVYTLVYDYFPLAFLVRFPAKFFFLTFTLLVYVTIAGLNAWLNEPGSTKRFLLGPAVLCVVFAGFDVLLRLRELFPLQWLLPAAGVNQEAASGMIMMLERQMLLLFSLATLLWLWEKDKIRKTILQALIVGIIVIDFYEVHRPYLFLAQQRVLGTKSEVLEYMDESSEGRIFFASAYSPLHPIAVLFPGARSPADDIAFGIASLRPNTGRLWRANYVQDIDALARDSYDRLRAAAQSLAPDRLYRLLGNLNVQYLVSQQQLPGAGISLLQYFPKYPLWLYRIEQVVPKVYLVPQSVEETDPMRSIARLAAPDFDPTKEVILDQPLYLKASGNFNAVARVTAHSQTRMRVQASLNKRGILVLADSFYPGWKVFVDGEEREIMRANFFFRAVQLTPGDHEVDFAYEPASLRYGLAVTLLTMGILLILATKQAAGRNPGVAWRSPIRPG
jgi:hypothetical protein